MRGVSRPVLVVALVQIAGSAASAPNTATRGLPGGLRDVAIPALGEAVGAPQPLVHFPDDPGRVGDAAQAKDILLEDLPRVGLAVPRPLLAFSQLVSGEFVGRSP